MIGATPPPPRIVPLVRVAHTANGVAAVPILCRRTGACQGRIAVIAGGPRHGVRIAIGRRQGTLIRPRVAPGATRLRLSVRLRRAPTREISLSLTSRLDRERCGFGSLATELRAVGAARLLRIPVALTADDEETDRIVACRDGRPLKVDSIFFTGNGGSTFGATSLSATWASVVIDDVPDYRCECSYRSVSAVRLSDGHRTGRTLNETADVYPLVTAVGDRGALVVGQSAGSTAQVRVIDDGGDRVVDGAPGVDLDSIAVTGDTLTWTRDGMPQTLGLGGEAAPPPRP